MEPIVGRRGTSDVNREAVPTTHLGHLADFRRARRKFAIQCRKHLNCFASCSCDLQHLAASGAKAEGMNRTGWHVYQRSCKTRRGLAAACKLNLALGYVKRLFPGMAMRRWASALVTRLERDLLTLGNCIWNKDGDFYAYDVERRVPIAWLHDEQFGLHGFASYAV